MELNWLESILMGLLSGLGEILPVSARAHSIVLLKVFGAEDNSHVLDLLIHLAIFAAVYMSCQNQILRYLRARHISRIPKKKRKRPLDTRALMDFRMVRTMAIPVIFAFFFFERCQVIGDKAVWLSVMLFLNGVILYIPQFFPGSNKDCRTLTRLEGLLMGIGGAASVLPGISGIGASLSIGSLCGVERTYHPSHGACRHNRIYCFRYYRNGYSGPGGFQFSDFCKISGFCRGCFCRSLSWYPYPFRTGRG